MPNIQLRKKSGGPGPLDLMITVQDKTFDYLHTSSAPEFRVSAYFDQDCELVQEEYDEIFVSNECEYETKIVNIKTGSRNRKGLELPCAMKAGEQLILTVERRSLKAVDAV